MHFQFKKSCSCNCLITCLRYLSNVLYWLVRQMGMIKFHISSGKSTKGYNNTFHSAQCLTLPKTISPDLSQAPSQFHFTQFSLPTNEHCILLLPFQGEMFLPPGGTVPGAGTQAATPGAGPSPHCRGAGGHREDRSAPVYGALRGGTRPEGRRYGPLSYSLQV